MTNQVEFIHLDGDSHTSNYYPLGIPAGDLGCDVCGEIVESLYEQTNGAYICADCSAL